MAVNSLIGPHGFEVKKRVATISARLQGIKEEEEKLAQEREVLKEELLALKEFGSELVIEAEEVMQGA